jgi:hypothetical protein
MSAKRNMRAIDSRLAAAAFSISSGVGMFMRRTIDRAYCLVNTIIVACIVFRGVPFSLHRTRGTETMGYNMPPHVTVADVEDAKREALVIYGRVWKKDSYLPSGKIDAIKYLRVRLGLPLKEAKDFFEMRIDPAAVARVDTDRRGLEAAPDLLAALRNAVLQIEYLHEKFAATGSGEDVLAVCRAAIAKATQ